MEALACCLWKPEELQMRCNGFFRILYSRYCTASVASLKKPATTVTTLSEPTKNLQLQSWSRLAVYKSWRYLSGRSFQLEFCRRLEINQLNSCIPSSSAVICEWAIPILWYIKNAVFLCHTLYLTYVSTIKTFRPTESKTGRPIKTSTLFGYEILLFKLQLVEIV